MHSLAQPFRPEPLEITGGDLLRELRLMNVSRRRVAAFDLALLFRNWDYVEKDNRVRMPRLIRSRDGELALQIPERNGLELRQDTLQGLDLRYNQPEQGLETDRPDFSEYKGWGGSRDLALRWSRLTSARSMIESRRDYAQSSEELDIVKERAEAIDAKTTGFIEEIRNRVRYFNDRAENLFKLNAFAAAAKDAAFCIRLLRFLDANDDSADSGCDVRGFLLSEVALYARSKAWMHFTSGNPRKATEALRDGLDELHAVQPLRSFENDDIYRACEEVLKTTELEFRANILAAKHQGEHRSSGPNDRTWKVEHGIDLQDIIDQWSESERSKGYRRIEGSHGRPIIQKMTGRGMLEIEQDHCWDIFKPPPQPKHLDFPELPEDHLLVWCKEVCTTPVGIVLAENWTRRLLASVSFFAERSSLLERLAFDAFADGRMDHAQADWRRVIRDCDVSRNTINLVLEYCGDPELVNQARLMLPRLEKQSAVALAGRALAMGNVDKFLSYLAKEEGRLENWLAKEEAEAEMEDMGESVSFLQEDDGGCSAHRKAVIKEIKESLTDLRENRHVLQEFAPETSREEMALIEQINKQIERLIEDIEWAEITEQKEWASDLKRQLERLSAGQR